MSETNAFVQLEVTMEAIDKRIATRIDCTKLVYIKCIDGDGKVARDVLGHIKNISKTGLRVESPLPIDTELVLISTLDEEDKSIGIRSRIVYSDKKETGGYILGIKFDAPETSCIKFIKAVVKASRTPIHPQTKMSSGE
jgi:hypothetical protein